MSKKLKILNNSLNKKESELEILFTKLYEHQKLTNGQPMNDKRNSHIWFNQHAKIEQSIRTKKESIEQTKNAIEIEENKISKVASAENYLPNIILDLVAEGKVTQWRKYPNRFFVVGVEKARIVYDEKRKVFGCSYFNYIKEPEQIIKFKEIFNLLNIEWNKKQPA